MTRQIPPDVLAERYATDQTIAIWSPMNKTRLLRDLWIVDLRIRMELGVDIPQRYIDVYERAKENIDLDSITVRELKLKHDVMANIEEFNAIASELLGEKVQIIHDGYTSRDETDNTEQLQILQSLNLMLRRSVAVCVRFCGRIDQFALLDTCGRSHLVPGQGITFGKRLGNFAEEFLIAIEDLELFIQRYPLRGIKGPMGTQQDMVARLGPARALEYENRIREYLGFSQVLTCVGQVYPRVLDFKALTHLASLASAMGNFSNTIRLMAGLELAHEGFKGEQAGSSSMPHKVNSRTCERIRGLLDVIKGFLNMTESLLGNQWLEGDVSCSVVRRVALPGAFYAMDGLFEAAMHVLDEMEVFPGMMKAELERFLPFLSTTALLRSAREAGMGREDAHAVIKNSSIRALREMREGGPNNFLHFLAEDPHFPLERTKEIASKIEHGLSVEQAYGMCDKLNALIVRYPEAADYQPAELR